MPDKPNMLIRSMQLASLGLGKITGEPLSAWLLANDAGQIIAEGWYPSRLLLDDPHIVNSKLFKPSTAHILVVNSLHKLSSHQLVLLKKYNVTKVIVAAKVSPPLNNKLAALSIGLEDSLYPIEEAFLNRRYHTFTKQNRPYIILKWAQTADGFVARQNYDSKWISNAFSRRLVHKWRTEEDAIMVGTNTARYDNPRLNVRDWSGKNPIRIVIDRKLRLDPHLKLFDDTQPTICYNGSKDEAGDTTWVKIDRPDFRSFYKAMLDDLYHKNVTSIIVEGGSQVLHFLIANDLWDEARVFTSKKFFKKGIEAPQLTSPTPVSATSIGDDRLDIYQKLKRK